MTVTIGGNTLIHIIDTLFSEINSVAVPNWINQSVELDTDIWTKKPLHVTYVLRCTSAVRWALDQLLTGATSTTLVDDIYSLNDTYWVASINVRWGGDVHWSKPWIVEIELINVT